MNKNILFLVDHKHRDLPGLSLIGHHLNKQGFKVFYRQVWDIKYLYFNPSIIIIPKANNGSKEFIDKCNKWRSSGIKLAVIETEGNEQWLKGKKIMNTIPDIFFFWNEIELEKHKNFLNKNNIIGKVIGSPRLDFFKPQLFENIHKKNKDILKSELNIDNNLKIITIATNNSYEGLSKENIKLKEKRYSEVYEDLNFYEYLDFMKDVRKTNIFYIEHLARKFKNYNIVLKPHPNENVKFWKDFIKNYPNIKLLLGKNISDLLCISDIHIGMTICLTIIEAKLLNIPTIELSPLNVKTNQIFHDDHIGMGDYVVNSKKELDNSINKALGKTFKKKSIDDYIKKYYYKFDGQRAKEYANFISNFLKSNNFSSIKNNLIKNFFEFIMYFLRSLKQSIFQDNSGFDKRGRFDNRIKKGDENNWLKLYQKIF